MFEKRRRLLPEVVAQIELFQAGADEISGIEDPADSLNDIDDRIPRGDGFRAYMVEALLSTAGEHQLIHNAGDFLAELPTRCNLDLALIH
jgi:hypothetical protein